MSCPPVKEIVAAVEGDEISESLYQHTLECGACAGILATLRDESEGLTICVGSLWVRERITCPHTDLLLAYGNGGLDEDEREYIAFHLDTVDCPHCQAEVARLQDLVDQQAPRRLKKALDDSMRRSAVFLDDLKKG